MTSAKTKDTFNKLGSDRQCCVEILAFSEVIRALNPTVEFVLLIKGCKDAFQVYVYFTRTDLLVRTTKILLTDTNNKAEVMGMFALFLALNIQINQKFPDAIENIEDMKCGWKKAFSESNNDYYPCFMPQASPALNISRKRELSATESTTVKKILYSDIQYP